MAYWVSPDAVEDKEELNEDAAEGKDATHEATRYGVGEPVLVWDFTGNLIGPYWLLYCL